MENLKPLPEIDAERFRLGLAGLCTDEGEDLIDEWRILGARFGAILARHYNRDELPPMDLWRFVEKALRIACAKAPGGDAHILVSSALETVMAGGASTARDSDIAELISVLDARPSGWREGFVAYLRSSLLVVLVYAREIWEAQKEASRA